MIRSANPSASAQASGAGAGRVAELLGGSGSPSSPAALELPALLEADDRREDGGDAGVAPEPRPDRVVRPVRCGARARSGKIHAIRSRCSAVGGAQGNPRSRNTSIKRRRGGRRRGVPL